MLKTSGRCTCFGSVMSWFLAVPSHNPSLSDHFVPSPLADTSPSTYSWWQLVQTGGSGRERVAWGEGWEIVVSADLK